MKAFTVLTVLVTTAIQATVVGQPNTDWPVGACGYGYGGWRCCRYHPYGLAIQPSGLEVSKVLEGVSSPDKRSKLAESWLSFSRESISRSLDLEKERIDVERASLQLQAKALELESQMQELRTEMRELVAELERFKVESLRLQQENAELRLELQKAREAEDRPGKKRTGQT
jgi:hypothetical protein